MGIFDLIRNGLFGRSERNEDFKYDSADKESHIDRLYGDLSREEKREVDNADKEMRKRGIRSPGIDDSYEKLRSRFKRGRAFEEKTGKVLRTLEKEVTRMETPETRTQREAARRHFRQKYVPKIEKKLEQRLEGVETELMRERDREIEKALRKGESEAHLKRIADRYGEKAASKFKSEDRKFWKPLRRMERRMGKNNASRPRRPLI